MPVFSKRGGAYLLGIQLRPIWLLRSGGLGWTGAASPRQEGMAICCACWGGPDGACLVIQLSGIRQTLLIGGLGRRW